ncbi:MAG: 16S rRNA (uracil(1498)-N(3))-methyltransferase [Bacilli bacterium]|nr:16S rRNA (uracil(1498)-N(3))-methyltransferase [Bacilli bacterium]
MQRYFGNVSEGAAFLSEDDQFHITKVMRAKKGDRIEVVSEEVPYLCEVDGVKPLSIKLISKITEDHELKNDVVLVVALIKGEKMDWVVQKATELGVQEIVFLKTERTIVKMSNDNNDNKLARYRRIIKEASEQSKRTRQPLLNKVIDIKNLAEVKADIKMIAYEGMAGECSSFNAELKNIKKGSRVAIMVGPEGGFSQAEVQLAMANGYKQISLGKRILRAETASIYALSVIGNYLEK